MSVLNQIIRYTDALGDSIGLVEKIVNVFHKDDKTTARILRKRAARQINRVKRIRDRNGSEKMAKRVEARALSNWAEAQHLDPIDAELAAKLDSQENEVGET